MCGRAYQRVIALVARLRDRVGTTFTFDDGNISDLEIAAPRLATPDGGRNKGGVLRPVWAA